MARSVESYLEMASIYLHSFQPDTLKCLAMFAGERARDLVFEHMNGIGNVMNWETNAHSWYDKLRWGIEARREGQKVRA